MKKELLKSQLNDAFDTVNTGIDEAYQILTKLEADIHNKTKLLKEVESKAAELSLVSAKLSVATNELEAKLTEKQNIESTLGSILDKLRHAEQEFARVETDTAKMLEEAQAKRDTFMGECEAESIRLNTLRVWCEDTENRLNQKEKDLKIIEGRYRKIFEAKGIGFKV
jgi:DNA repair ATPase RecN